MSKKRGKRNFSVTINKHVAKSKARSRALVQTSFQRLIEEASTPMKAGGKMRIDTSALVNSIVLSYEGMPAAVKTKEEALENLQDFQLQFSILSSFELGQTIFAGWTVKYAIYREQKDGFMISAARNWGKINKQVVKEVKIRWP